MSAIETFKEILKLLEPHYEVLFLNPAVKDIELKALEHYIGFELPEDFKTIYRLHNGEYQPAPKRQTHHHAQYEGNISKKWFDYFIPRKKSYPFTLDDTFNQDYEQLSNQYLNFFCGYKFLTIKQILWTYWDWQDLFEYHDVAEDFGTEDYKSIPSGTIDNIYVKAGWLPFATSNASHLAIDFAPDSNGVVGQIINFGPDDFNHYQIATSFTGFLEFVLEQYQQRKFHSKLSEDGENHLHLYDGLADLIK